MRSDPKGILYAIPIFIVIGIIYVLRERADKQAIAKFTSLYGFSAVNEKPSAHGGLFALGMNNVYQNMLVGTVNQTSVKFFEFNSEIGSEYKKSHSYEWLVGETIFDSKLPEFYLTPKRYSFLTPLVKQHYKFEETNLEGTFMDKFSLCIPTNTDVEALELFTPNVLQAILDSRAVMFATNGKLYWLIQSPLFKTSGSNLQSLYLLIQSTLPGLSRNIQKDSLARSV
jgi:hypothetical protein